MGADRDLDPALPRARDPSNGGRVLAARLQQGDPAAFQELFQRERRRAFALAMRVVGDASLAEEAVQEAFAQIWERAEKIRSDGGKIESLLMTIVRRRAVDVARRRRRSGEPLPDPDLLYEIDERASRMLERVEDNLSSEGLRAALKAALLALPSDQRRIVTLAYLGDRSLREIAEREGLPLGTVKSRLRLGMTKLTEAMRGWSAR